MDAGLKRELEAKVYAGERLTRERRGGTSK